MEDSATRATFERRLKHASAKTHVSTMTYTSQLTRYPANIETVIALDVTFRKSTFGTTAYECRPLPTRPQARCRLYITTKRVLITGVVSIDECLQCLWRLARILGDCDFEQPECRLININIDLAWTLNRWIIDTLQHINNIRYIERQESHPATIVHCSLGEGTLRKAMIYGSGKASFHVESYREAESLWKILEPAFKECRGIKKSCGS